MWTLLFLPLLFAQTIMVKAPNTDPDAYQVFAENSNSLRPSDLDVPCDQTQKLLHHYNTANDQFVNGSLKTAKEQFSEVTQLKWKCDWKLKERKAIIQSFFRLSQLEEDTIISKQYITEALQFDNTIPMEDQSFPPPLLQIYQQQKKQMDITQIDKNYDTQYRVLRNGREIKTSRNSFQVITGKARYTFLSDSSVPFTTISEPQNLKIPETPLVQGDCQSFTQNTPTYWENDVKIFFGPECIVDRPQNNLALTPKPFENTKNTIQTQMEWDQTNHKPSWLQRNYLWVGAAIVAAVVISTEMNQRKDTQTVIRPTNTRHGD